MEFRGSRNQVNKEPQHRINESIRAAQVRVVGENIEPGVYPLREALAMGQKHAVGIWWRSLRTPSHRCAGLLITVNPVPTEEKTEGNQSEKREGRR